jgi:hypothetical protein
MVAAPLSGSFISLIAAKLQTSTEKISAEFAFGDVGIGADTRLILEKEQAFVADEGFTLL